MTADAALFGMLRGIEQIVEKVNHWSIGSNRALDGGHQLSESSGA